MKKIIVLITALIIPVMSFAAFENWNYTGRAMGLAGAFTSIASDAGAIIYNPAGTAQLKRLEISAVYARPYMRLPNVDIYDGSILFATPWFDRFGFGGGMTVNLIDTGDYRYEEYMGLLNGSYEIEDALLADMVLDIGLNFKILGMKLRGKNDFGNADPVLYADTTRRFTVDAGGLAKYRNIQLGVKTENILPVDFGIVRKEQIPRQYNIGLSYEAAIGKRMNIVPVTEIAIRNKDVELMVAFEYRVSEKLAFQAGRNGSNLTFGISLGQLSVIKDRETASGEFVSDTLVEITGPRVDFSYLISTSMDASGGTPHVGILWRF